MYLKPLWRRCPWLFCRRCRCCCKYIRILNRWLLLLLCCYCCYCRCLATSHFDFLLSSRMYVDNRTTHHENRQFYFSNLLAMPFLITIIPAPKFISTPPKLSSTPHTSTTCDNNNKNKITKTKQQKRYLPYHTNNDSLSYLHL